MPIHRNQSPAEKGLSISLVRQELVQRTGNEERNRDLVTRGVEKVANKQEVVSLGARGCKWQPDKQFINKISWGISVH